MVKLVIAEKPSVAKSYAEALGCNKKNDGYFEGNGYIVSWCYGHLVGLADPEVYDEKYKKWDINELPIMPTEWRYVIKKDTSTQYKVLKNLLNSSDVSEVICGTDAGREGELIFRHVYTMAKCNKPIKRLWVSSMEINSLKKSFNEVESGEKYYNLYQSALLRERLDWLVGYNFTRLVTLCSGNNTLLSVGRVQTPTLAMICERDDVIANFKKEKSYVVHIKKDTMDAVSEHLSSENEADTILSFCMSNDIVVDDVKKEKKKTDRPKMFDLTSLQREANKIYGFTADKTLKLAQSLYEKGYTTYPRTDSTYLTEDMKDSSRAVFNAVIKHLDADYDYFDNDKLFDNSKISDHHAIIPTVKALKKDDISADELTLYNLVCVRFISAFNKPYLYESTAMMIKCGKYDFKANGNVVIDRGFKAVEDRFIKVKADKEEKEESVLPDYKSGDKITGATLSKTEDFTKPKSHYTEATLLSAMEKAGNKEMSDDVERKGLGTSATRAEVIETLVKRQYIKREGKKLLITDKGKFLVSVAPDKLKSVEFTADMENDLLKVSKGLLSYNDFKKESHEYINGVIKELSDKGVQSAPFSVEKKVIAKCPICHSDIYEGNKNYYCSNKDCKVVLFKEDKYLGSMKKKLTEKMASDFFEKGFCDVKGLTSKKGNKFDARIIVIFDENTGYPSYKMEFNK